MATGINIPISYSPGSIDQILKDFDAIIQKADISNVFVKDQEKIRAQFATIGETIRQQLASGKIDLTKINFTGLEKDIEDFARKVAFVLNEAFEKEVAPYAKKITQITDQIVVKQQELTQLNEQAAKIGGDERKEFKEKWGLNKMPALDKGNAKIKLAAAEEELSKDSDNVVLQKKVEMSRELLEMLSTEKERKKEIKDQISKKELEVLTLTNEKKAVQINLDKAQAKLGADAANFSQKLLDLNRLLIVAKENGIDLSEEQIKLLKAQAEASDKAVDAGKKEEKSLIAKAGASFSYGLVLGQLRRMYQQTLRTVIELDKAMTDAAIVTSMNRKEAYELLGSYQELARKTGLATSEISGVVVEFLKQGRTMKDAMELAEVAAKSAKVAGISADEAVKYLTSAVNGFQLAASQAESIADKFAAVAASSATDFEELAVAMSKVSPVAKSAGVGVDFMMGVLAKGLETTREAPENIGTAFKTIFARMREVTDIGKATEDGMSLNRVEKALSSVGVRLRDSAGQFRNLEEVLTDVGNKWTTLTSIEQAYIATSLAGTRQQPRLLAIFNDFARTKELIQISTEATGELSFQHQEYMMGAEAALSLLKTAWEGFIMAFTETDLIIGAIESITNVVNGLTSVFNNLGNFASFSILLGIVGMAYSGLIIKHFNLTMEKQRGIAVEMREQQVKKLSVNLTVEQKQKVADLTLEYQKANAARRKQIDLELEGILKQKMHVLSLKTITLAIWANIKAMVAQLAMQVLVTGGFALIGVAIGALVELFKRMNRSSADFAKEISENNKELKELGDKEKNVKKLVDRFDELNRKVVRSKEELNELASIAEELQTIKVGEQEFNLSRTDITGKSVIDKVAYDNFIAAVEKEREKLLAENLTSFTDAVKQKFFLDINDIFSDRPELIGMARKIGFDFGYEFLNSMSEKGFSQENINDAISKLQSGMAGINAAFFVSPTNLDAIFKDIDIGRDYGYSYLTEGRSDIAKNIINQLLDIMPQTSEELTEKVNGLVQNAIDNGLTFKTAQGLRDFKNIITQNFSALVFSFDQTKAKEFSTKISQILLTAAKESEAVGLVIGDNLSKEVKAENLAKEFEASIEAYRKAIRTIEQDISLSDQEERIMLSFIADSMQDENILDILKNQGVTIPAIVEIVQSGTTLSGISDLIDNVRERLENMQLDRVLINVSLATDGTPSIDDDIFEFSNTYLTPAKIEEMMGDYYNALTIAFTKTPDFSNFEDAYEIINEIFGRGSENATVAINALSNALNTLNATSAATKLTDSGKLVQDLLKLPEQIAKGDFSKYSELVAEFGFDTVNAVLKNGTTNLDEFFEKQRQTFENSVREAIANIYAVRRGIDGDSAKLSDTEQDQVNQLELMLEYYNQIAGVEQLRVAILKEVKDLVKQTNDLYSLQDKLIAGGMSGSDDFIKMLDKAIELSETNTLERLNTQIEKDIQSLNSLGVFIDGVFSKIADASQSEVDTGINKMIESITQLVNIETAAYSRQKKMVEERYKEEMDAVKKANDDKWQQLDYNNKLVESEEQIINARRQLMGLALSGASQGEYQDAQKALEKLQQERQKTIENQIIDEAQKELEQQRDEELIAAQKSFTDAIKEYTDQLAMFTTMSTRADGSSIFSEQSVLSMSEMQNLSDELREFGIINTQGLLNLDTSTIELTSTNRNLIIGLQSLTRVIDEWEVRFSGGANFTGSSDMLNT